MPTLHPWMLGISWEKYKVLKKLGCGSVVEFKFRITDSVMDRYKYEHYAPIWAVLILDGTPEYLSLSGRQLKQLRRRANKALFNDAEKIAIAVEHIFLRGQYAAKCKMWLEQLKVEGEI